MIINIQFDRFCWLKFHVFIFYIQSTLYVTVIFSYPWSFEANDINISFMSFTMVLSFIFVRVFSYRIRIIITTAVCFILSLSEEYILNLEWLKEGGERKMEAFSKGQMENKIGCGIWWLNGLAWLRPRPKKAALSNNETQERCAFFVATL